MRRLLLALPFALLPLVAHAQEHDHDHEHGSLGAHEHGVATLNLALDGQTLEIALESPAMNIVGFEHAATKDADRQTVAAARASLEQPLELFGLPTAAGCKVTRQALESPLFAEQPGQNHDHDEAEGHSDIDADYAFTCSRPQALENLDLSGFFKRFAGTRTLNVQLIGPSGQQGVEATPDNPVLKF